MKRKQSDALDNPAPTVLRVRDAATHEFGCRSIIHLNAEASLDVGLVQVEEQDGTFTNAAWRIEEGEVRFKDVTSELTREDADGEYDERCIQVITAKSSSEPKGMRDAK